MKHYKVNFFSGHQDHCIEVWAKCQFDVEKHIVTTFHNATGIYVWLV